MLASPFKGQHGGGIPCEIEPCSLILKAIRPLRFLEYMQLGNENGYQRLFYRLPFGVILGEAKYDFSARLFRFTKIFEAVMQMKQQCSLHVPFGNKGLQSAIVLFSRLGNYVVGKLLCEI